MIECSAKNCFLITKNLYKKTKQRVHFFEILCDFCHEMFYCSVECKDLDWKFSHQFKCSSRNTQIKKQLSDYIIEKKNRISELQEEEVILGKGSLGVVKLVKDVQTNRFYALKTISKKLIFKHQLTENLKREIRIQKKLSHPNILKLYEYFEDKEFAYLVLQFAPKGSLADYLCKKFKNSAEPIKKLSEKEAFYFFIQTCLGLDYLHKNHILHRDLKPENLLLDEKRDVLLCDFGWSIDETATNCNTLCGTLEYMAPEVINSGPDNYYNKKIDIWSLGVILYEFLNGKLPGSDINFQENATLKVQKLIIGMLKKNPEERLTMDEIFDSEWVKSLEKDFGLDLAKKREKYINFNDRKTENIREIKNTNNHCMISSQEKRVVFQRQRFLSKNDFRNLINRRSSDEKIIYEIDSSTKGKNKLQIKKMLEKKTVFTITEIKDNKEGSFFDKIFEFIGCVKKSKE